VAPNWITSFAFLAKYDDTSVYESTFIKWWRRFSRLDLSVVVFVFWWICCFSSFRVLYQDFIIYCAVDFRRWETRTQQKRKKKKKVAGCTHTHTVRRHFILPSSFLTLPSVQNGLIHFYESWWNKARDVECTSRHRSLVQENLTLFWWKIQRAPSCGWWRKKCQKEPHLGKAAG
jgi:hypothetical protein